MCLVVFMVDPEPIFSRVNILVYCDFVANNVDVSLDLCFLYNMTRSAPRPEWTDQNSYRMTVTLQAIQMMSLQHKVPRLPAVVPVSLLLHPTCMIGFSNLIQNALSRFKGTLRLTSRSFFALPMSIRRRRINLLLLLLIGVGCVFSLRFIFILLFRSLARN
jgi:hypothetical protein